MSLKVTINRPTSHEGPKVHVNPPSPENDALLAGLAKLGGAVHEARVAAVRRAFEVRHAESIAEAMEALGPAVVAVLRGEPDGEER